MSSERATATALPADVRGRYHERSLAGLIDVLDRADAVPGMRRTPAARASAHRHVRGRSRAVRAVPLRSVRPAPTARVTYSPRVYVVPEPQHVPITGIADLFHRAALWGAGPQGENLAWRVSPPAAADRRPSAAGARRPARSLLRRLALWGSGPGGTYLAWGRPALPASRPDVDRPVELREMPSTPMIQPAASSPAAAQPPRVPASSAGARGMPPAPRGAVAVPGVRPSGPPERSRATGWPPPARGRSSVTGLARTRGDPVASPARGSPPEWGSRRIRDG